MTFKQFFGDRAFLRSVVSLGLPIALQNLLSSSASMVDTFMIGTQGELAVAAVGICSQIFQLFFAIYWGFVCGGTLFFAQYWGAKDEKGICRAYGLTLTTSTAMGLIFAALAIFAPQFLMQVYTDKPSIQAIGVEYLRIAGISYPIQIISSVIACLLRSTEKIKVPLVASIITMFTNLFFNWVFIYGNLGAPAMGASGAAMGTLIAAIVNLLVLLGFCLRDKHSFVLRIKDHFGWSLSFIRQYILKALPIIGNDALYGVGMLVINAVIGRQSEESIAALAVFRVIEGLVFSFFGGFCNANSVLIGKKIGSGNHMGAFDDAKRFAFFCPAITFIICVLLAVFRTPLLGIFNLSGDGFVFAEQMILLYIVMGSVRSCNYIINNTFRASGAPIIGAVLEIGGLFLMAVPAVYLAGIVWKLPFFFVFCCIYADEILRVFISLGFLSSTTWIRPVTKEGLATLDEFRASMQAKKKSRRLHAN